MKLIDFLRVCKTERVIINMERYNVLVYAGETDDAIFILSNTSYRYLQATVTGFTSHNDKIYVKIRG